MFIQKTAANVSPQSTVSAETMRKIQSYPDYRDPNHDLLTQLMHDSLNAMMPVNVFRSKGVRMAVHKSSPTRLLIPVRDSASDLRYMQWTVNPGQTQQLNQVDGVLCTLPEELQQHIERKE